eukprot:3676410-Prymnesium_polylepis.1
MAEAERNALHAEMRSLEEKLERQTALATLAQATARAAAAERPSSEAEEAYARVASLQSLLGRTEREAHALREQARSTRTRERARAARVWAAVFGLRPRVSG